MKFNNCLLLIAICITVPIKAEEKLRISIYIEALCRYSRQFIVDQFSPTFDSIKNYVVVEFYTLGKSKSFINETGGIEFECQHGPSECRKNKFQTCGLHKIGEDQNQRADFIICTMGFEKSFAHCANSSGLNQQYMDECVDGQLGTELQLKMEEASAAVIEKSGHVPTITLNWEYNVKKFYEMLNDFKSVVLQELSKN